MHRKSRWYVENAEPKKFLVCSLISVSGSKLPLSDLYDEVQRCCIYFKAWNLTSLCHAASNLACTQLISHSAWYHTFQFMHLHWEALKWVTKGCFYITPHLIYLQASECFPLKKSGMRFKSACASFPAVSFFLEGWAPFLCLRITDPAWLTNPSLMLVSCRWIQLQPFLTTNKSVEGIGEMGRSAHFILLLWISASEKRSRDHISKSHKHCVKSFCLMASNPQRVRLKRFCRASSVLCNLWLVLCEWLKQH